MKKSKNHNESKIFNEAFLKKFINKYLGLILKFLKISIMILLICFFYIFAIVPSESMYPTLEVKDMVIIQKNNANIAHNDIIVFYEKSENYKELLIKRVIGIEGDTIEIKNKTLFINGEHKTENYVLQDSGSDYAKIVVPKDSFFVMGDNRYNSLDSRFYGVIKREDILGKAKFRVMPLKRFGKI